PLRVTAVLAHRVAHRREIDDARDAGEILEEDARGSERDLLRRLVGRDPAGDCLDLGVAAVPEHVLEQDTERVRKPRNVPLRLESVEAVDRIGLGSDAELLGLRHDSIQAEARLLSFTGSASAPAPRTARTRPGCRRSGG